MSSWTPTVREMLIGSGLCGSVTKITFSDGGLGEKAKTYESWQRLELILMEKQCYGVMMEFCLWKPFVFKMFFFNYVLLISIYRNKNKLSVKHY